MIEVGGYNCNYYGWFLQFAKKKKGERWDISIYVKRYGKTYKKKIYSSIGQDIYVLDQEVEGSYS